MHQRHGSAGTVQTSQGGKGAATSTAYGNTAAGKTSNGDMYAGHDGNVYKNTGSGWQTYNNGSGTRTKAHPRPINRRRRAEIGFIASRVADPMAT